MNKPGPQLRTLDQWLEHVERVHPQHIAMGLERVTLVRDALELAPSFPIIAVGGTNGKGSACAMLEAILGCAGYRTGCYTSPHLIRYNERVRIAAREAPDGDLACAFDAVERARSETADASAGSDGRGAVQLTYFEFGTLAAMWLFVRERVDVAILEVGLGGRLDAVNAFDGACAIVTSVDLDHMDYLGPTREHIAFEKAGIYRPGQPAICAALPPPESLLSHAEKIGAHLLLRERDFGAVAGRHEWQYWGPRGRRNGLPHPALRGDHQLSNASACLAALDCLHEQLPIAMNDVRAGLLQAENPGRFQVLPGRPAVILDVAHNRQAAQALAENLSRVKSRGRTIAVFSMLGDKDIRGVVEAVSAHVAHWCIGPIDSARAAPVDIIERQVLEAGGGAAVSICQSVRAAYVLARGMATEDDKILVFGSFYTVAAVMRARIDAARSHGTATD